MIKHLILLKIQNMMNINGVLLQWSNFLLKKKAPGCGITYEIISNKEPAEELHKPIIRKFKAQSPFIDNIWGADLADM